jgi:capsid protein
LHLFERLRPGQVRGVPWFASVILKLRDLDDYDDAELIHAAARA